MGSGKNDLDPVFTDPNAVVGNNVAVNECGSATDGLICNKSVEGDESNKVNNTDEVATTAHNVAYVYRQDVVRHKETDVIGIVDEVAGDSDSDSSITDEDEYDEDDEDDGLDVDDGDGDGDGQDDVDGSTNENEHGDKKKTSGHRKKEPLLPDQVRVLWMDETEQIQGINDVKVVDRGFLHGDYVASASNPTGQVGVVVDVNISVDLLASDGSVVKDVSSKDLKRVREFVVGDHVILGPWLGRVDDVMDNVTVLVDDGSICKVLGAEPLRLKPISKSFFEEGDHFPYYPGQRVRASSSSVFKNSRWLSGLFKPNRLEGTVTKVAAGSVFIYWIASAGYGPDSSMAPAEEQNPKNLKLLASFAHANWQVGDWCLVPPTVLKSASISLDSELSNFGLCDPMKDNLVSRQLGNDCDPEEENYERALLIYNTRTSVDVAWQDGTVERGLESTKLIPIDSPGDHEFVSEQYVVEKASDDTDNSSEVRRVGVVKSVNAKERTACVKWLKPVVRAEDPREFDREEIVSVYELEGHADYDYSYGDVVVRLSPVSVSAQTNPDQEYFQEPKKPNLMELSWVGNITGLINGDIEVTWADGMVSTVGPQAIFVVGRDEDDESIAVGSDVMIFFQGELLQNATGVNSEVDANLENNSGSRSPAVSLSLAAFGFVTRLATGIFSRGRKHSDADLSDNGSESESQRMISVTEERDHVDISGSQNSNTFDPESPHGEEEANGVIEVAASSGDAQPSDMLKVDNSNTSLLVQDATSTFKRFDSTKDPLDHYYVGSVGQISNSRKWLRKVQQDWNILQNNLPDGIYVRVYEDRMDLLRAVIVGAYGTPYQDGLFFFDFHLPPEYPDVPPSAYYHSGGWRINPNLYEEGKVCLSLLNTWTGRGNEVWDPTSSSILQVLVSLQGLVLNSRPYFNEAGYDKQVGTAEGEKNSLSYNENTFLLNCKTMMYLMRRPPKDFEELVKEHFKKRGAYILKACDAYMKGSLIGSLKLDASASNDDSSNLTSVGFKLMLTKIVPKLYTSLNEVGADCQEYNHLLQQL
ncbi:Probable ubiquitin-conjugating enzyme E2 23 [Linum perenne]